MSGLDNQLIIKKLNEILAASINEQDEFEIGANFVKHDVLGMYILSNKMKSPDWFNYPQELKVRNSLFFKDFIEKYGSTHPMIKLGNYIFEKLGHGDKDYDDKVILNFPYKVKGITDDKLGFGDIKGFAHRIFDPAENPDEKATELESAIKEFRIYFVPDPRFFEEMNRKITKPRKEGYVFYSPELNETGFESRHVPSIPRKNVELMYNNAYINMF